MEPTQTEYSAFWAVEIRPGDGELLQLNDGETLHVTMVTLGPVLTDRHDRTVVTVEIGESGKKYALCSLLPSKAESHSTDLTFTGEESIRFAVVGKNAVHLVGSFAYEDDDEDSEDEEEFQDLADLENIAEATMHIRDDEDDEEDDDEDIDMVAPKLIKEEPPIIEELKDGDSKVEKIMKPNGIRKKTEGKTEGKKGGKKRDAASLIAKAREVKKSLAKRIDRDKEIEDADDKEEKAPAKSHEASQTGSFKKRGRDQDGPTPLPKKSKPISERVPTPAAVKHPKNPAISALKKKDGLREGATEEATSKMPKKKTPKSLDDESVKSQASKDKNLSAPSSPEGASSPKKKRRRRRNRGKASKPETQ